MILLVSTLIVKFIGIFYKIPLNNYLDTVGRGYFGSAFNLYVPIYSISMAGLPMAITKLVSQNIALGRIKDVRKIFRIAKRLFLLTGIAGTIILLALAYPYAKSIGSLQTLPAIFIVTPSIFFCCIMSTYRGYYAGLRNMSPSAMSQVWEAVAKFAVGIILAKWVMDYCMGRYEAGLAIFGKIAVTESEAMSIAAPYGAAAAIAGVTMGTVVAYVYLVIYHRFKGNTFTRAEIIASPPPASNKRILRALISIAIPVVATTFIMNLTNLIDAWSIQFRLQSAIAQDGELIRQMYQASLAKAGILPDDKLKIYLYGAYEMAVDFKNLLPSLTATLGISAIPVLSEAWTLKNRKAIRSTVESVIRVSMLIAMPAGFVMAIVTEPILMLLYKGISSVPITVPIMMAYSWSAFMLSLSQPMTSMMQGIGRMDIPLRSLIIASGLKIGLNYVLVGIPKYNVNGAIAGSITFFSLIAIINLFYFIKETKTRINITSVFLKPLFCSVLMAAGTYSSFGLLKKVIPMGNPDARINGITVSAVISVAISIIIYALALLFTKTIAKYDVLMLPKGEKIAKTLEKFGFIG